MNVTFPSQLPEYFIKQHKQSVPSPASFHETFAGTSVLLLLVGQAFRGPSQTKCDSSSLSFEDQEQTAKAYVKNVFEPLEAVGARVSVFVTFGRCDTRKENTLVSSALGVWYKPRVVASKPIDSTSMGHAWEIAWRFLLDSKYSDFNYVLHARHDLQIIKPINRWPTDFRKFNFEQRCWRCCDSFASKTGFSCDGGCCCGKNHPFVKESVSEDDINSFKSNALCGKRTCVADRLMWVPHRHVNLVAHVLMIPAMRRHVIHTFHEPVVYAMEAKDDNSSIGFLFPPDAGDMEFVDLHVRRDRLKAKHRMNMARQVDS